MSYNEGCYLRASDKMRISIVEVQNQENGDWESRLLWNLKRVNRRSDRARCIQFTLSNPNPIGFILILSVSTFMSFKRSRPSTCPDPKSCKQFWAVLCVPHAPLFYLPLLLSSWNHLTPIPGGCAVYGVCLASHDSWDRGFESYREDVCSSVVFVECCAGSCLCEGLIAPSEECYRLCVPYFVWSRNINKEAA